MTRTVYIILCLAVLSCTNHNTATTTTVTVASDTPAATAIDTVAQQPEATTVQTDNAKEDEAEDDTPPPPKYIKTPLPTGIYRTILPCEDCKGIEHIVAFYPNNTYRIEEKKIENDSLQFDITTGDWKPTDGVIWLYKDQVVKARYTWKGDTLMYLMPSVKKSIALHKMTPAAENEAWQSKRKKGISFFGVGNEPFWSIEIDNKNAITFYLVNKGEPLTFLPTDPVRSKDSIVYHIQNDSTTLRAVIYHQFCSDGMSDFIYNEKVTVQYNGQTFNGCGMLYK